MATKTRVYRWQDRLIRATHPAHVLAHVAQEMSQPHVATQDDLLELIAKGVQVESLRAEQSELPTD